MRISADAVIPRAKLRDYLLLPRRRNDKSQFLAQAGFRRNNVEVLEAALRRLIAENEARVDRVDECGVFYRVEGASRSADCYTGRGHRVDAARGRRDLPLRDVETREMIPMKPELYQEVALIRDIAEVGLRAGDVATLVDYVPHPAGGEEGVVLERFNAGGESIGVITVPVSAIASLSAGQVPAVRPRVRTA